MHLEPQIQKLKLAEELSSSTVRRNQQLRDPLQGRSTASTGRSLTTETSFSSQQNQQQPSDVAFTKEHKNYTAALQQLTTDSFLNNQHLVTLINSNDDVKDTSPSLPTAKKKRYTQNAAFQLIKTTSPRHQQLLLHLHARILSCLALFYQLYLVVHICVYCDATPGDERVTPVCLSA
ncbi:flagellar associated protein [Dorcoceras hygrometricum]|uniref:Flagellar associated protein n=1 Tax=Dorcoceras hygrometricum TaxID=472368 RepID=A0A2Z7D439_9LAMI|nr:flagellar associated protein [Dorcoceras hygrometricum]